MPMSARTTPAQTLVPLDEVAGLMGGTPLEVAIARLPGHVEPVADWRGRPCVPADAARKLLDAWEAEAAEALARQTRYETYLSDRQQARQAAGQVAYEQARWAAVEAERAQAREEFAAFVGAPSDSPYARQAGRAAQREALRVFDRKHPVTRFADFEG